MPSLLVVGKLVTLGGTAAEDDIEGKALDEITATRPAILDRNGTELAVDIRVPSLYAEPNRMVDKEQAIAQADERSCPISTRTSCATGSPATRASSGSSAN